MKAQKLFNSIFCPSSCQFLVDFLTDGWIFHCLWLESCECILTKHAVFIFPFLPHFPALLHNDTGTCSCLPWSLVKTRSGGSDVLKPSSIAQLLQTLKPFVWDQCLLYISWKRLSRWPLLPRTCSVHFRWALMEERKKRKWWIRGELHLLCLHLISLTAPLIFRCDWSV